MLLHVPKTTLRSRTVHLSASLSRRAGYFSTTLQHFQAHMYDNKIFGSLANTDNGEVGVDTRFHYHQKDNIVWAEYSGGSIVRGSLIGKVLDEAGNLEIRYHHINQAGELMTGRCLSTAEKLSDGRVRLHEKWQWTSGDCSSGESLVEEIKSQ